MQTIAERYARLRAEIPPHVAIVAVSKFVPAAALGEAIAGGVTDVGENYLQEARSKFAQLPPEQAASVRKHFIGHVQTNKARAIAAAFDVVQSVDRWEAGAALSRAASEAGKCLSVLVQINISSAPRFGCPPSQAPALAQRLRELGGLRVDGVMAIGPLGADRSQLQCAFADAAIAWKHVGGPVLSLGMSDDWREALAAGSTMIRVGTGIFGPRPARAASKNTVMFATQTQGDSARCL